MFGIGFGELVVIAVAALVLAKPGELGALARKAGKFAASLRAAREELEGAIGGALADPVAKQVAKRAADRGGAPAPGPEDRDAAPSSKEGVSHDR
jgi:Sec-independent protein translocase protein TatA